MGILKKLYANEEDAKNRYETLIHLARKTERSSKTETNLYAKYKKAFWVGLAVTGIQQLTGINTVSMYSPIIFGRQSNSDTLSAVMAAMQVLFAVITPLFVDRFGRRTIFIWGAVISTVAHLLSFIGYTESAESTARNWVLNVGILIFAGVFNSTYGVLTYG